MKNKKPSVAEQLVEAFALAAAEKGCPREQVENFIRAGVFLQPKQLEFCAYARLCDGDNGFNLKLETYPNDVMLGGGRAGSKTHAILAQIFCDDCVRQPGLKVLVLRKVGRANREQIQDFRKKLLVRLPHNYREQASTITFENGSLVVLGNFKDEKDIDKYLGLEYDVIHIVESNQITITKKMNILSCLRTSKPGWRPRCYEDTNPGGIGHFHNKQIFIEPFKAKRETETRYIHCTVDDNAYVNPEYRQYLEKLQGWQREAWLHGSWEFLAGAYFTTFRDDIHVYPNATVNFSVKNAIRFLGAFDYGYGHRTAFILAAQDANDNTYIIGEYTDAEKTPSDHAERIKALLRGFGLEPCDLDSIVAGHDCFHRKEDGNTIAQTYAENGIDFMPAENARVNGWQRMLDCMGDSNTSTKPTLFIHRDCVHLIAQIKMAQHSEKIAGDVQKFDYVPGDAETFDDTTQEGDDCLDACFVAGTKIRTEHGDIPIEKIKVGDMVWTRKGLNRVCATGIQNLQRVLTVKFSDGSSLTGTGEHPIWHEEKGWSRLDSLRYSDKVSAWQNTKPLSLTESNSAAIQKQNKPRTEIIIGRAATIASAVFRHCIRRFTNIITRLIKSLPDSTSIIRTKTHWTIAPQTSSASWERDIYQNTSVLDQLKDFGSRWIMRESSRQIGMEQKRGYNGIHSIGKIPSENLWLKEITNVSFAISNLLRGLRKVENSVPTIASRHPAGCLALTESPENVACAEAASNATNIIQPKLAAVNVVDSCDAGKNTVFNLEVENCHEYFANGILVHNCRYLLFSNANRAMKWVAPLSITNFQGAMIRLGHQ